MVNTEATIEWKNNWYELKYTPVQWWDLWLHSLWIRTERITKACNDTYFYILHKLNQWLSIEDIKKDKSLIKEFDWVKIRNISKN